MTDDTAAIQHRLDTGAEVALNEREYLVRGLELRSGNRLVLAPRTVLRMGPAEGTDVTVAAPCITIDGAEDAVIEGGVIDGTLGGGATGIRVQRSRRIHVRGTRLLGWTGDAESGAPPGMGVGISVGFDITANDVHCEDIVIADVSAARITYAGLMIAACTRIHALRSTFRDARVGIQVEGTGATPEPTLVEDLRIDSCVVAGNDVGIDVVTGHALRIDTATITSCSIRGNHQEGVRADLANAVGFSISESAVTENGGHGIDLAGGTGVWVLDNQLRGNARTDGGANNRAHVEGGRLVRTDAGFS